MKLFCRTAVVALVVVLCCMFSTALADLDDMPIVTDQPLTEADIAELEALKAQQLQRAQQLLIDLGYLTGNADGIFGPRTANALREFQASRGIAATGELDDETLSALEEMAATLENAMAVQQRLIDLSYLRGKADGIFGERSQAALKLFQTLQGLEPTGKLDDATQEKLFDEGVQALPARLSSGDNGDAVVALQRRLIQFGFLNGDADGVYGKNTAAAVRRFQSHLLAQGVDVNLGVEVTGEATPVTQLMLMDPDYSSYISDIAPGYEGDEAARVERKLIQLGYMDAQADAVFDDYAVRAAQAFQTDAGLEQGTFDRDFFDALFAENPPVAEHFVLHDIAYGDKGIAVREVEQELLANGMTIQMPGGVYNDGVVEAVQRLHDYLESLNSPQAALFDNGKSLNVGAQQLLRDGLLSYVTDAGADSDSIRRAQRRLYTLFYLSKKGIDGKLGDGTRNALKAFQETNGLAVTGNADAVTLRALFSENALCKRYPYRVEVDISAQRVHVFELNDAGGYDETHTFICSTGLGDSTPKGIFLNGFPVNRWHYFEKFNCWAQYSFEIEGNIMFHSVIYSSNSTDSLRQGSVYALGSKASHGCIRLRVEDARWLYEHCKRGSIAIVIY